MEIPSDTSPLVWQGAPGERGSPGPAGAQGATGESGSPGAPGAPGSKVSIKWNLSMLIKLHTYNFFNLKCLLFNLRLISVPILHRVWLVALVALALMVNPDLL